MGPGVTPPQLLWQLPLLLQSVVLICVATIPLARGSEGDTSELFRRCQATCLQTGCTKAPGTSNTCDIICPDLNPSYQPPVTLQLMNWDCSSDCSYNCMWALEGPKAAAAAGPVYKYFGKWPFIRVLGAQEIASVVFSIANLLAHLHNIYRYIQYTRALPKAVHAGPGAAAARAAGGNVVHHHHHQSLLYPYYWLWIGYSLVNINAWWWSTVFHCRDTKVTEKFDYFSADLTVAAGLAVVLIRSLQLQHPAQVVLLGLCISSGLLNHIYYMAFIKFDYGYNMKVCIAVGLATACAWVVWVAVVKHPGRKTVYQFMGLVHAAMLLEVLDFPPMLWLFDAHALWHAVTVPLTYLWYKFVFSDVAWVARGNGNSGMCRCSSPAMLAEGDVKQKH